MNTANLQLEGLYLVLATLNEVLIEKGVASRDDIAQSLRIAEQTAISDYSMEDLSPANRDAVAFPARLLQLALRGSGDGQIQPFSELARLVGETKGSYNDQQ